MTLVLLPVAEVAEFLGTLPILVDHIVCLLSCLCFLFISLSLSVVALDHNPIPFFSSVTAELWGIFSWPLSTVLHFSTFKYKNISFHFLSIVLHF